ncbi:MAG: hypothetical protein ACT4O3_03935 [Elusimicrobiota bacterium]
MTSVPPAGPDASAGARAKKIRKFKVQPRLASVLRGLKALTGDTRLTPELEKAVEQEIQNAKDLHDTAALYATFNAGDAPPWTAPLWESRSEAGAAPVALTVYAATVGAPLEKELAETLARNEALRGQILTCLGEEAAEQAAHFVYRLVQEEAKDESCELSPRLAEPERLPDVLSSLEADKIGIRLKDDGRLSPRFARAGHVLWWPPAKKGRGQGAGARG